MTRRKFTHPDVQYGVTYPLGRKKAEPGGLFDRFDEAVLAAFQYALAHGSATLDVVIYTERGARWYGGDKAVKQYRRDPEETVFTKHTIKVKSSGMLL